MALLACVLGVLAALVGCGGEEQDAPASQPRLPLTAFERHRGEPWTTLAEETAYLRELDRRSERIRIAEVGRSGEGRPIRLVVAGPARTRAEIAAGASALFVCTQHGDEPAGREACLQRLRDHAAGGDRSTLLFIPTANPDGVAVNTRGTAAGTDMNRDHLELGTAEAAFIAAVMRDYRPDLLGDLHEYRLEGAEAVLFQPPDRAHPNTDAEVRDLSGTAVRTYLAPALGAGGFRTGDYVTGGTPSPGVLLPMAGLRHTAAALVETPRRGALSPVRRVAAQRTAIDALARMLRERGRTLAAATDGARRRAAAGQGRAAADGGATCAFRLSDPEFAAVRDRLALDGVRARRDGTSWLVPLAQPAAPVVPVLLGPDAPEDLPEGQTVAC